MERILITVEGGTIQHIASTSEIDIIIVDYDNMEHGDKPVTTHEPDTILQSGNFHELYTDITSPQDMEVRELLKDLGL